MGKRAHTRRTEGQQLGRLPFDAGRRIAPALPLQMIDSTLRAGDLGYGVGAARALGRQFG